MLITLELRRLEAEIRKVENGDPPHQAARLRAVLAAYDQVLLQLCERLDVPTDVGMPPLPSQDRLALEAEATRAERAQAALIGGKERHAARGS